MRTNRIDRDENEPIHTSRQGPRHRLRGPMLLAGLAGAAIIANATLMQREPHPSPFFQPVAKAEPPLPPVRTASVPVPAPVAETRTGFRPPANVPERAKPAPVAVPAPASEASDALVMEIQRELAKRGRFKGEADGKVGPVTVQAIRDFQFSRRMPVDGKPSEGLLQEIRSVRATMKDELLDLVKRANDEAAPSRTVSDVQRALNKAGYGPLDEDGHLGPSTRTAIARFERDRNLPVRGEAKGPVLRALASASGVPIQP